MEYKARFLGVPEFFIGGSPHIFPFRKAQILTLMLIEEKSLPKDKICNYLWADKTMEKAHRNLSNAMSLINKFLPVNISNNCCVIDPRLKIWRDIDMLPRIRELCWTEISELCHPFMDIAELEDYPAFSDWLLPKREHYHKLLVKNLKDRALLAGCQFEDAILCYERLAECEPYDEKIHSELVRLYIKTNQKVKAVDTARSFSQRIKNDFGIEADLCNISTLMKRTPHITSYFIPQTSSNSENNPLARNDEILKMLDFFLRAPEEGVSSCGMLWGEQGIGKTAFCNEITALLAKRGWECLYVDCRQEEKNYMLAPIIRLMKHLHIPLTELDSVKLLSELNYYYIVKLIYQRVSETTKGMHRLLVVENIQWLDDASWNIIESIMYDSSAQVHMLVSGFEEIRSNFILRTTFADKSFEKFEITLRRFNLEETARICHEMAPDCEWSEGKIHNVYMQTEGNPFFIKKLLEYQLDGITSEVPYQNNTYLSMIELLGEEERLFLDAIAVCPEYASMKEVAKVLEISPLQVSKFYDNLRLYCLLREQEGSDGDVFYYFTHTKIKEVLQKTMSLSRKVALHAKNIEILEAVTLAHPRYSYKKIYSRLYYHCHEAKLPLKELFWRIRDLELHFMAVHEVFPTLVDQDLIHYIPSHKDACYTRSAMAEAEDILNRIFRTEGGSPALLRMERDLYILKGGYLWWSGCYDDADSILRGAVRKAISCGEPEALIKAGVQMCYLAIQTDNAKSLSFYAGKLYKFARKTGLRQWEGIALRFLAIARILAGRYEEVEKYLSMSTTIFEKLEEEGENYTVCLIAAEHFRGDWKLAQCQIEEALVFYKNCVNIGESAPLFRSLGLSLAKVALCLIMLERYDEAEAYLQRMSRCCNIIQADWENGLQGGGIALSLMGIINCRNKDYYRSGTCFKMAKKLLNEMKRPLWQAIFYWAKLQLFKMCEDMPREFAQAVLLHPKEWYEEQLESVKHKIGWIKCDSGNR